MATKTNADTASLTQGELRWMLSGLIGEVKGRAIFCSLGAHHLRLKSRVLWGSYASAIPPIRLANIAAPSAVPKAASTTRSGWGIIP
jgi:hypothetical protein